MDKKVLFIVVELILIIGLTAFKKINNVIPVPVNNFIPADAIKFYGEKHFVHVKQLTFGVDNAEAYFSFDGKYLIFQKANPKEGILFD